MSDATLHVYFAQAIGHPQGPVKIGVSADPQRRLKPQMSWAIYPMHIVATMPGDRKLERRFHLRFLEDNTHSEVFRWTPTLGDVIARVAAGDFDADELPPFVSRRLPSSRHALLTAIGRERMSLATRLRWATDEIGISAPPHVTEALAEYRRDETALAARQVVLDFVADPLIEGLPGHHGYQTDRLEAYLARRTLRGPAIPATWRRPSPARAA